MLLALCKMLAREVSRTIPGGHRQSLDDDARGGLRRKRLRLPPPHVIICDAPVASLCDASSILEGSKSNRYFDLFCAARHGMPQKLSEIPTLLGLLRAAALQVPSESRANRSYGSRFMQF